MRNRLACALSAAALGGAILFAEPAHAGIEACGNINVEANATCVARSGIECEADCTPIHFEAACAGELYVSCSGNCSGQVTATCQASCDIASCQAQCEANPGSFDCEANCTAQAEADCSGRCSAEADRAKCEATCKANASGECKSACEVEPPTATCQARCEASCTGQCQAESTLECQLDCQANGYATCESRLTGGCQAQCRDTGEGALFCDGQYVDHGGNLQSCIDALKAELNITVTASGSAQCEGNTCEAQGEAACQCGVPGTRGARTNAGSALGFAALGLATAVLRRRRR